VARSTRGRAARAEAVTPASPGVRSPGALSASPACDDRGLQIELETPHGPARAHVDAVDGARGALVLGHGAGGGVAARDLVVARGVALELGVSVALVEQPYRVAGRKSSPRAEQLDAAWTAVVEQLPFEGAPLITGGRSAGARVACRTAAATGAAAVLCLAFPLHPPGRPEKTRLPELEGVGVPVLIVQGASDPFGVPPEGAGRKVVVLKGNHSLSSDVNGLRSAVRGWLGDVLG
jgi:predicted alpha/beta-hydrolase family hydrolase